ncbi:nitrile hydratase subunit alpha [Streptomyces agglomeratus]|uniref:nitrile hydratase subunit alpha n=1 Tax=Streptomyces agglomeratus TaxID=285458 RepID=UPI000854819A|nr:nitrile hydratase subunit alpha [Streptomyces agglomeratus]OEJ39253.1 nitrile hydratase subunit alpha [Streptomyces agglomeratus]OEJ46364.1 nitrile hydratase subunit alpha [Streptomyces agglomeratus]OEJ51774.1 nitrile hydratase subunit alpha [Streptomyces agglomeratus]OEJ59179.1 nitrile hydratase subunit alpha [Streptomyces agglomeratus]
MTGTTHSDALISRRVRRLETLLEERGIVTGAAVDEAIDAFLTGASAAGGARVVARAWTDPGFRERLLADGTEAVTELGLSAGGVQPQRLRVVENTAGTHNIVVCTLCSCYPVRLLGPSPSWYKSEAYRSRVVREPRAVLAEFGLVLPQDVAVTVWDSTSETRYMVLPRRPAGTEHLDEPALASLVTRNALIGTAAL